jgi:hypothetical protein
MAEARKTYNRPDCHCGEDHDSIKHIVHATLVALRMGVFAAAPDPEQAASAAAEKAAADVGWVKTEETE